MLPILVTGATGNVGAAVVQLLAEHDVHIRAAVRPDSPQPQYNSDRLAWVPFDFKRPATYATALRGVQKLFLVRPPAISDVRHAIFPLIDAAQRAGVEHIVFLSLLGVEKNPLVPHYSIERYLQRSGLSWTFLRASFFLQNLSTTHRGDIQQRNEIFVPAGHGRTSFIDVRDIAAVGVRALTEPGHAGEAYALTGDQALDYHEVAAILSEVLGRPIRYRKPTLPAFIRRTRARGTPLTLALLMGAIYTTARLGLASRVTDDVRQLLDRPAITVRRFAEDHRACWTHDE